MAAIVLRSVKYWSVRRPYLLYTILKGNRLLNFTCGNFALGCVHTKVAEVLRVGYAIRDGA